jgi:hypothetical protein
MTRAQTAILIHLFAFMSCATCLLEGCGGHPGDNGISTSSSGPTSAPALTTSTTATSLDSSVPSSAAALVSQVVSVVDAKPLGSALSIPSDGTGFSTPIFAVDQNQNLILAALSSSQTSTTQFSAKSTAETLAVTTLGVSDGVTASQLISAIDAAPSFSTLVSDVQTALSEGASPLTSQSVAQDLATVLRDTVTGAYQQSTVKPFAVHPQAALPTETAAPPLPFTVLGLQGSLAGSVYIASNNTDGSLNIMNTFPIAFAVSSRDTSGSPLGNTETLQAYSLASSVLSNLYNKTLSASPTPAKVTGNGQKFVVTVDATPREAQNATKALGDTLQFVLSQAFNMSTTKYSGLSACSQTAAQAIMDPVITSLTTSIGSATATPEDFGKALKSALTTQAVTGAVESIIKCTASTASDVAVSTVIQTAVTTTMKAFLAPYWEIIQLAYTTGSTIYAASGPVTEIGTTYYYWNKSVDVNVCETNGQLGSCTPQLSLKVVWTSTPLGQGKSDAWDGTSTLTIANGQYTYSAAVAYVYITSKPDPSCNLSRQETGSGGFATPQPPKPGSPWSFTISVPITWLNYCATTGPGSSTWGGSYSTPSVVIQATPAPDGSYTLSTNTTYPLVLQL